MANRKLTDTELVILSAAGARDTGLVLPLPKSVRINRGTQTIVLRGLLTKELIATRPAQPDEEVWEAHEDGSRSTLVITDAGLAAVGIAPGADSSDAATPEDEAHSAASPEVSRQSKVRRYATSKSGSENALAEPAKDSKLGMVIAALRRRKGATIADLMAVTGWQAHSVRGAISGALKKKLGLDIVSEAIDGRRRVYRIDGDRA